MTKDIFARPYSSPAEMELESHDFEATAEQKLDARPDENLTREELTDRKRYGDLRRHTQEKEADYKRQIEDLQRQVETTQAQKSAAPLSSDDEMEQLEKDHPKLMEAIRTATHKATAEDRAQIAELRSDRKKANVATDKANARALLMSSHPDAATLVGSDAWYDWVESKPKGVQNHIYDEAPFDGELICNYVAQFKAETGISKSANAPSQREIDAAAARTVGRGSSGDPSAGNELPTWTEAELDEMSQAEYEQNSDAIDLAHAQGRILP